MACVVKNCGKRLRYDYGQFCDEHSCGSPGCITDPIRGSYCVQHNCHELYCTKMVSRNAYCVDHSCRYTHCTTRIYNAESCAKHMCVYVRCNNMRQPGGKYCAFHEIMMGGGVYEAKYKLGAGSGSKPRGKKKYDYTEHHETYYHPSQKNKVEICKYCDMSTRENHKCIVDYCYNVRYHRKMFCNIHLGGNMKSWISFMKSGYGKMLIRDIKNIIEDYVLDTLRIMYS